MAGRAKKEFTKDVLFLGKQDQVEEKAGGPATFLS